ncbi:MAG: putative transposase [Francisella sp.]|jgi:putative transposase
MTLTQNLPHVNLINSYQFVTFRTKDSIDGFVLNLQSQNTPNNTKQANIDNYLDNSLKGSYLNDNILDSLYRYLINLDNKIYELAAFSIMPNHVHILFKQTQPLAKTIQQIKGGSAKLINDILKRKDSLWCSDYFDRTIRDEKHFEITYNYIENNALKANLQDHHKRFYSTYQSHKEKGL